MTVGSDKSKKAEVNFIEIPLEVSVLLNLLEFQHFQAFSQICGKRLLASSCLSVSPSEWNNPFPNGRIFMKFGIGILFENL